MSVVEAVARLAAKPAKRVVRRRGEDVGADGGGVNPPASPACSRAVGGEGLAPPSPWSVQRRGLGVNCAISRRPGGFFVQEGEALSARGCRPDAGLAQGPRRDRRGPCRQTQSRSS